MIKFNDATRAQIRAANPKNSTWVSANAGSGKTRVLTNRVARLLLHETDPQKILCLTYTKAAAAEMQNRLFDLLGEWSMMEDDVLCKELLLLGEDNHYLTPEKLRQARTLFANALETPGGLKIQTIHSFCDTLLRQFPLEADVSPRFNLMEEREKKALQLEVLDILASRNDKISIRQLVKYFTHHELDDFLAEIVKNKEKFTNKISTSDFNLSDDTSVDILISAIFSNPHIAILKDLLNYFPSGKTTDVKNGKILATILNYPYDMSSLEKLKTIFLTKDGRKKKTVPTKNILKNNINLYNDINLLKDKLEQVYKEIFALKAFHRTKALYQFSQDFLKLYTTKKQSLGFLDYDDLINKTRYLLKESSMAQWVLYRLDGGIEHILVDEAQDTSPEQWDVVVQLHNEFTSGASANMAKRTIFIVGDEKQSIYSFQGADPRIFDDIKQYFNQKISASNQRFEIEELLYSFRSAKPIMELVDHVFKDMDKTVFVQNVEHHAFNKTNAGRIDIWPFLEKQDMPEKNEWYKPLDLAAPDDPWQVLATQIAVQIKSILEAKTCLDTEPVCPGDFLILLRRRSPLFHAIIKELKVKNIPVSGADRFEVGAELAVRDIISLLKFISTPDDDLSLAETLRSPLFRLSEGDLFTLAHGRTGNLWQSLRNKSKQFLSTYDILIDLRNTVDFLRPYELIECILDHHNGRKNLLARLGSEAEDGIDELLSQALVYEKNTPPTLSGFLNWFDAETLTVKRVLDSNANHVRVMTIHGAKGLESPIVILPDTAKLQNNDRNQLAIFGDNKILWKTIDSEASKHQQDAQDLVKHLNRREEMRLLYVALTRAKTWLIICGAGDRGKNANCWYDIIASGVEKMEYESISLVDIGLIKSIQNEYWVTGMPEIEMPFSKLVQVKIPDWLIKNIPHVQNQKKFLSPSQLPGAKVLQGENSQITSDLGMERGSQLHLLLEYFPKLMPEDWKEQGYYILSTKYNSLDHDAYFQIFTEAKKILSTPNLAHLFLTNSLAEVGITAKIDQLGGRYISGYIDRLVICSDKIIAVDFKSNIIIPKKAIETPSGLLAQMGTYLCALQKIYPDKEIEIALLWTKSAELMILPHNVVMQALSNLQDLDPL